MDKEEVRCFLNFLESANWEELMSKQSKLYNALNLVVHEDTKSDIRFCLRLVDEEISARVEVSRVLEK